MRKRGFNFKGLATILFLTIGVFLLMPAGNLFASGWDLDVTVSGSGTVSSNPPGINCLPTCFGYFSTSSVTLTAFPSVGYQFSNWTGDISGSTNPYPISNPSFLFMTVTANFTLAAAENHPPVLNPIGDKSVEAQNYLGVYVSAWDPDGDPLTYWATGLPPGASFFNQSLTWIPNLTQVGTYQVTFWVSDGQATDGETITITVITVNHPPVLDPIGDKSVKAGVLLTFIVSASDADEDPLTFSVEGLPEGAAFNEHRVGQTFSWTPDSTQIGTYQVTFSVTDGKATDSETITITVRDVNRPPVLDPIGDKIVNEGELLVFDVSASDPDGDPLTFSATGLPGGAEFNSETGHFEWIPAFGQAGTYLVEFSVSDGEFTDSETVFIAVGVSILSLPEPFPYEEVYPSQGAAGVDPEGLCFIWPATGYAEEYDLFVSRNREFTSLEIEVRGLRYIQYCITVPAASRTNGGLDYGQSYYWKIIARNIHGEVNYPVFGFFTRMPEELDLESPQPLEDLVYQKISIPLYPENPDPEAVLGDDLGPYNPMIWRLFRYESSDDLNHEYPDLPDMTPGLAYWLIVQEGVKIDAQGAPVDTENDFVVSIPPGFFQLGCPFPFPVSWGEVKVRNGSVTVLIGDPDNEWMSPYLWKYANGEYAPVEVLEPWNGYWVENMSGEAVELLIPPVMYVEE